MNLLQKAKTLFIVEIIVIAFKIAKVCYSAGDHVTGEYWEQRGNRLLQKHRTTHEE